MHSVSGTFNVGPSGDLYVYLDVEEITGIQRDGINLNSTISISYVDAILGTIVKVKKVEGTSELQIPPGTQPGDVLVLARKGAPKLNKPSIRGDHLFKVKVTIPKRVSAKEKELLEELSSLSNTDDAYKMAWKSKLVKGTLPFRFCWIVELYMFWQWLQIAVMANLLNRNHANQLSFFWMN